MIKGLLNVLVMIVMVGSIPFYININTYKKGNAFFVSTQDNGPNLHVGDPLVFSNVSVVLKVSSSNNPSSSNLPEEVVYDGSVTVAVMYGTAFDKANEINGANSIPGQISVQQNNITKQLPWSRAHTLRIYVDLSWPGIEQVEGRVQDLYSQGKKISVTLSNVVLRLSLDRNDGFFGYLDNFAFDSLRGGWLSHDLPDGVRRVWVQPAQKDESNIEIVSESAWEVEVFETTPKKGNFLTDVCAFGECLPGSFLTPLSWQVKADDFIPVFCPGQMANGMTVKRHWLETRIVWDDFTREQGLKPFNPLELVDQSLLFVEIASGPPKRSFVVAYDQENENQIIEMEMNVLYGQSSSTTMQDRYAGGLRFSKEGLILTAFIPSNLTADQLLLIQFPYGPVWRLTCN